MRGRELGVLPQCLPFPKQGTQETTQRQPCLGRSGPSSSLSFQVAAESELLSVDYTQKKWKGPALSQRAPYRKNAMPENYRSLASLASLLRTVEQYDVMVGRDLKVHDFTKVTSQLLEDYTMLYSLQVRKGWRVQSCLQSRRFLKDQSHLIGPQEDCMEYFLEDQELEMPVKRL
ncbi:hypothetical protein Cadr_000020219 [Camelus dromedarius]|uniref:KRAB domain-containing protein n=1 Tax=Camelus dromedarius TaxID=9838 RepID=A0A5N4CZ46_CAMDR|nr:hypothetical protein Cadr_000020219 [Camelus dromedarius]